MAKQPQVFGFSQELGQKIAKMAKRHVRRNGVLDSASDEVVFDIRYAVIASDPEDGDLTVLAWAGKLSSSNTIIRDPDSKTPFEVINLDAIFTSPDIVRAGYGFQVYDDENGNQTPICQRCIPSCTPTGTVSLDSSTFSLGDTVNETVSSTGTISGLTVTGLPDGLAFATGAITGSPTKTGVFWLTVQATAVCTITKLVKWIVE